MVEQWNSDGRTVWWNSGTVMVEQWWNSGRVFVDQCGGTLIVEQCGGTLEGCWLISVVEQWHSDGGTVWWKSGTVMVKKCGGIVNQ